MKKVMKMVSGQIRMNCIREQKVRLPFQGIWGCRKMIIF